VEKKFKNRTEKWQWLVDFARSRKKSFDQLYIDCAVFDADKEDPELAEWFYLYNSDHKPIPKGVK
jgi:hypothetical protein